MFFFNTDYIEIPVVHAWMQGGSPSFQQTTGLPLQEMLHV